MSNFHTDADLIRHYAREFMCDGKEHTAADVLSYIHQVHGKTGVTGEPLDYRKVGSAFQNLIKMESGDFVKVRRGVYKRLPHSEKYAIETFYSTIADIVARVENDINAYLADNFKLTEYPDNVIQTFRTVLKDVYALLGKAVQIMAVYEAKQREADSDE